MITPCVHIATLRVLTFCIMTILLLAPNVFGAYVEADYVLGMQLGKGFETLTDSVKGQCVEVSQPTPVSAGYRGQRVIWDLHEVRDSQQFSEEIDASASASFNGLFFKASGKASFLKKQEINQFASTFVASVKVDNGGRVASGLRLTPEAEQLARRSPSDFRQRCGNTYIVGLANGGEFYGFISIKTNSQKQKEKVAIALRGSYKLFSANGDLKKTFQKDLQKFEKVVRGFQLGGRPDIPLEIGELVKKAKSFPSEVQRTNILYKAVLEDYTNLPNYPPASQISQKERTLIKILNYAWSYKSLIADINYILRNQRQFFLRNTPLSKLDSLKRELRNKLTQIEGVATRCRTRTSCEMPKLLHPEEYQKQLPLRYESPCDEKLELDPIKVNVHQHTRGDTEMKGHNPSIDIKTFLTPRGERLFLSAIIEMKEDRRDWTTFKGKIKDPGIMVFDTKRDAPGCSIDHRKQPKVQIGTLRGNGGKNNHKPTTYSNGSGILTSARCLSDTRGKDAGRLFCDRITFNQSARVMLNHIEDTMTPQQRYAARFRSKIKGISSDASSAKGINKKNSLLMGYKGYQ